MLYVIMMILTYNTVSCNTSTIYALIIYFYKKQNLCMKFKGTRMTNYVDFRVRQMYLLYRPIIDDNFVHYTAINSLTPYLTLSRCCKTRVSPRSLVSNLNVGLHFDPDCHCYSACLWGSPSEIS